MPVTPKVGKHCIHCSAVRTNELKDTRLKPTTQCWRDTSKAESYSAKVGDEPQTKECA